MQATTGSGQPSPKRPESPPWRPRRRGPPPKSMATADSTPIPARITPVASRAWVAVRMGADRRVARRLRAGDRRAAALGRVARVVLRRKVKVTTGPHPTREWTLARLYAPRGGHRSLWASRAAIPRAPRGAEAGRARSTRLPRCGAGAPRSGRRRPGVVHGPRERRLVPPGPRPLDGGGATAAAGLPHLQA